MAINRLDSGGSTSGGESYEEYRSRKDREREREARAALRQFESDTEEYQAAREAESDDAATSWRDRADSFLRSRTGGSVGISDDFTSRDDSGGVRNVLSETDDEIAEKTDFLLDNERFSIQDSVRKGLVEAPMEGVASLKAGERVDLSDDEIADAYQDADEGLTRWIDDRVEGTRFEDGRLGQVTDTARWAGDEIVLDGGRILFGTATGIDSREGTTEFRTGGMEVADIGITALTAGGGKALFSGGSAAARGSDDAARFLDDVLGRSTDDAAGVIDDAARVSDDVPALPGRTLDDADDALNLNAGSPFSFRGFGESTRSFVDDVTSTFSRGADDAARVSDDAARTTDDSPSLMDRLRTRVSRSSDDASRGADDAARAADESDDAARGLFGPRTRTAGLLGGGAILGGGGAMIATEDLPDEIETPEGTLVMAENYPELEGFDDRPGGTLYSVQEGGRSVGYTLVTGITGRKVEMMDADGNITRAPLDPDTFEEMRGAGAAPGYFEREGSQ